MCRNCIAQAKKTHSLTKSKISLVCIFSPNTSKIKGFRLILNKISLHDPFLRKFVMFPCTMFIGTRCRLQYLLLARKKVICVIVVVAYVWLEYMGMHKRTSAKIYNYIVHSLLLLFLLLLLLLGYPLQ